MGSSNRHARQQQADAGKRYREEVAAHLEARQRRHEVGADRIPEAGGAAGFRLLTGGYSLIPWGEKAAAIRAGKPVELVVWDLPHGETRTRFVRKFPGITHLRLEPDGALAPRLRD